MVAFPSGLESGYAARLLRRFRALRTLVLDRMGPAPTPPEALDAVRRTQSVASGAMAPEARSFMGDAKALEVAVTREVARSLKADPKQVEWQGPQVAALLAQWASTQAKLVAKLEADVLADIGERVAEAPPDTDLRALVTQRFAAHEARARLIARNELGSLMAQLTQLRAKGLGADRYRWESRDDPRVRPLHAALDGTVRSWADPHPTEGHPGQAMACRCVAVPVRDAPAAVKGKATVTATPPPAVLPPRPPAPKPTPKPLPLPTLGPLPTSTPPPVLPGWTPQALPTFPAGGVSPLVPVPVLAPPAPVPVLPALQIPAFPAPKPRPAPSSVEALAQRTYREFRRSSEAEAYGAELQALRGELTQVEEAAVGAYTGAHYGAVNAALRTGKSHRLVDALDAAIDKAVIPADIVVRRGINSHPALGAPELIRPGDILHEPAYTSTSLSLARSFAGKYQLKIRIPAGSKALWVDDLSDNAGELELILARGARLQVLGTQDIGGAVLIECVLLP